MLLFACSLGGLLVAAAVARWSVDEERGARRSALLTALAGSGAVAVGVLGPARHAIDAFDVLVLCLIVGMGATVLAHASRALRHEPYQRRFATVGPLLVLAVAVTAISPDLRLTGVGWVATSILTIALVRTGPPGADPRRAVRISRAFATGDAALVAAVAITVTGVGSPVVAGLLLVVAVAARSASGPFARWLPDTLAAPTPTSALLHAGVVGSGAVVLIRHGSTVATTPSAGLALAIGAVVVGGITCVVAEAVMTTRPDVKGQLAWSTVAQLSFTMVLVGLGLHVAAGLHLVAHGFYKGALFLGSGAGVRSVVRSRSAPGGPGTARVAHVATGAAAGAALAMVVAVSGTSWDVELAVPLGLAWVALWCASGAALRRLARPLERVAVAAAAVGAAGAYATVTLALKGAVGPDVAVVDPVLPAALLVPVLAALAIVAAGHGRAFDHLWDRVRALGVPVPPRAPSRAVPAVAATVGSPGRGRSRPAPASTAAPATIHTETGVRP